MPWLVAYYEPDVSDPEHFVYLRARHGRDWANYLIDHGAGARDGGVAHLSAEVQPDAAIPYKKCAQDRFLDSEKSHDHRYSVRGGADVLQWREAAYADIHREARNDGDYGQCDRELDFTRLPDWGQCAEYCRCDGGRPVYRTTEYPRRAEIH